MQIETVDHVALWVADRDALADFLTTYAGMHVIDRTEKFTLVGSDARRGKLTLFAEEGPREPGVLARVGLRVFDLDEAAVKFRKAMATLCDLVSRLPSAIVVISCLENFYDELKKLLTRPIKDRLENDPRPIGLQTPCDRAQVENLIGRRLKHLFEMSHAPYNEAEPTFPLPDELVRNVSLVGPRGFIKERLAAYAEAGVTTLLVHPLTGDRRESLRYVEELRELIPLTSVVPPSTVSTMPVPNSCSMQYT